MTQALRFPRGLYGITPEWDDTQRLLTAVRAAHAGGMQALQWRRKRISKSTTLHQSQRQAVLELCIELNLPLIINDDWQVAKDLHTAGAHLGRDDGVLAEARQGLHPEQWLGCTCYNQPELAEKALLLDVNYVAFGTAFSSNIKPDAPRVSLDTYREGRRLCEQYGSKHHRAAVVAIGGITTENAATLIEAGVDSIAVISSLFESDDIYATARLFSRLFV